MSKREFWIREKDGSFEHGSVEDTEVYVESIHVIDYQFYSDPQRRFDELLKHADAMAESFSISNAYTIFTIQNTDEKVVLSNFQSFRDTLGESK
jgi:hypothetical protein